MECKPFRMPRDRRYRRSIKEAAALIGVARSTLLTQIRLGRIPAKRCDGRWWLCDEDIERRLAERLEAHAAKPIASEGSI
jgi:excisionase family DNA binding protein